MESIKEKLKNYKEKKLILLRNIDYENEQNPLIKLISNYEETKNILNLKDEIIYKYLYFNKKKVHDILYDEEEVIHVDFKIEKTMIFYFYLNLLINDNTTIVNYSYSIDFIKEIKDFQKNNNDNIYKKIIISKICIDLINNYKQNDKLEEENEDKSKYNDDKEKEEEILNEFQKENEDIINENIKYFKQIGSNINIKEIISKKIDEIYIEIIISLIKSKKFENYEYVYKILSQLDFEKLSFTKLMFDKLKQILNSNENYIKDYEISKYFDLYKEKNINFYYILLKFLLKNPIHIYQIKFIKKIKDIMKSFIPEVKLDKNLQEKFNYIYEKIKGKKEKKTSLNNSKTTNNSNDSNFKTNSNPFSGSYQQNKNNESVSFQPSVNLGPDIIQIEIDFNELSYIFILNSKNETNSEEKNKNEKFNEKKDLIMKIDKDNKIKELNKESKKIYNSFKKLEEYIEKKIEEIKKITSIKEELGGIYRKKDRRNKKDYKYKRGIRIRIQIF